MNSAVMPLEAELAASSQSNDILPPKVEQEEFDVLAFELWHLGSCSSFGIEDWLEDEDVVASRASCL